MKCQDANQTQGGTGFVGSLTGPSSADAVGKRINKDGSAFNDCQPSISALSLPMTNSPLEDGESLNMLARVQRLLDQCGIAPVIFKVDASPVQR